MTEPPSELETALISFFEEVRQRSGDFVSLADRDAAEAMWALPGAGRVREIALTTAIANRYLTDEDGRRAGGSDPIAAAGRELSGPALHRLGLAGLLRSDEPVDMPVLAAQTAAYLAGPVITLQRHLVLNVDWNLAAPLNLVGWRLWRPNQADWNELRPVPLAAGFAAKPAFDPILDFGEHLVLSAEDPDAQPADNRIFWRLFQPRGQQSPAWASLLCLNLAHDTPVVPVADYLVEPGRSVVTYQESIPVNYLGPEGDYEVPLLGPLAVDEDEAGWLPRFLSGLSCKLDEWIAAMATVKASKRLPPIATRFLETCDKIAYDTEVNIGVDASEVIFDYVVALERLVSASEDRNDLKRRTAQRTAVLVGRHDTERLEIYNHVDAAYKVRSAVAHGSEVKESQLHPAVNHLRPIVRRALVRTIILGPHLNPDVVFDEALLSTQVRRQRIEEPVAKFLEPLKPDPESS
ncbi:HEPN domain-containing protein [Amycolatopsis sp. FBCC-B4732]|uniref:HEPN domain-containing protein n=1 Tax=Amycolatopsis sp. FBCC-B4732 TaxID=3079339 RepID=UPI001FF1DD04|nr:HEPN domain-containing protein [Amycolatopsis sp. FBCC-B4732]UOX90404.1 HEPN domain-containing protein [Amycolatopsis sp. FBCC-B4732]